jgi:UDP-glucuronate decarboxylase
VRIFNTYGPRLDPEDGRVVSNFVMQGLRGEPFTIYGDGQQTRSFCYVDDLIGGILALARSCTVGPVNIGNPVEFTMLELANVVRLATGSEAELRFEPLPGDDPLQRRPDISLAQQALSWQPMVQLEEGINRTVRWFADSFPHLA